MTPRRSTRRISCALTALGMGIALTACGQSEHGPAASPPAQQQSPSSSGAAPAVASPYDIARVDNVKDDFPPGFKAVPHPTKTLDQQDIDHSGVVAFTKATIDPPQCRSLIIPPYAEPTVGTHAAGTKADGDQGYIDVVAIRKDQPVPASPLPAGCDKVTMSGAPQASGTAERIPAPTIAGVTTTGVELSPADEDDDPDYIYTAALDSQTSVVVMGSTAEDLNPQQMLSDLLVKATAAVRGQ
jgi:hypothetical protein